MTNPRSWLVSTKSQILIVSFMCFCTVGTFNVLLSIGGNGLKGNLGDKSTVAVNAFFLVSGMLGGGVVNLLGPRLSLGLSSLGYPLYAVSFYLYLITNWDWVVILAGSILGCCAGVLWSAQGQIMMSYPTEGQKGVYVSIFWMIFNLGSVLGGFIPFGLNFNNVEASLSPGTYLGLAALMLVGSALSFLLAPIDSIIRSDGRKVMVHKYKSVAKEGVEVLKMFKDWKMLAMLPLFLSSNWVYSYQFRGYNSEVFNIRTRALNTVFYWFAQMAGALLIGKFLDVPSLTRSKRGLIGLLAVTVLSTIIWACGLRVQLTYTKLNNPYLDVGGVDFSNGQWGGLLTLYIAYGLMDSMVQTLAYWTMGSLNNDPLVLSRYAGFYKATQSLGATFAWAITTTDTSYLIQLLICWILFECSVPTMFLVLRSIKDTNVLSVYSDQDDTEIIGYDMMRTSSKKYRV